MSTPEEIMPDEIGFGGCRPERSDPRHAPVLIIQEDRPWDNHINMLCVSE
jgi:hypothetical protein